MPWLRRYAERMTVLGVVRSWSDDDGWGVIDSLETPGGCWTHFSSVDMPGYRTLSPGQGVTLDWEPAVQDGFAFRAVRARPATTPAPPPAGEHQAR